MDKGINVVDITYSSLVPLFGVGNAVAGSEHGRSGSMVLGSRRVCRIAVDQRVGMSGISGRVGRVVGSIERICNLACRDEKKIGSCKSAVLCIL